MLGDPTHAGALLAVMESGDVVGFAEVSLRAVAEGCRHTPVGYLEGWYVASGWRGRGIGRRLVEAAEGWALARGCREMASDTELDNTASQAAHARLGYEEVERVVLFRKALGSSGDAPA